jgi:hypothetical protein
MAGHNSDGHGKTSRQPHTSALPFTPSTQRLVNRDYARPSLLSIITAWAERILLPRIAGRGEKRAHPGVREVVPTAAPIATCSELCLDLNRRM